ncbi:hypothetical protein ACHHYP_00248 [Achlya hypogyna]|uniref:Homeobox and zinc-finger domain-containing protein n=1 Tax=Achlya hypogyna TaxID=1202772 RepID=A0A1V9ZB64_ACHHY|nr:hypothetical protein ACHHYP_00248 [Achlya hypogyna]
MSSSSDDERGPSATYAPVTLPPPSSLLSSGMLPPLRMHDPVPMREAAPMQDEPMPSTALPSSISTGTSLLANLVKAKAMSDDDSSDDDDDASNGDSQPPSDDETMRDDEDELEQLLLQQEAIRSDAGRSHDKEKATTTICEVCHEDTLHAKRALVCAQCNIRFHPTCFRQKYAKLITTNVAKKWFCPDCEPIKKNTPAPKTARKGAKDVRRAKGPPTPTKAPAAIAPVAPGAVDAKYARLVDVALKAGKKFNAMVLEKSEEMLHVAQGLKGDVEGHFGSGLEDDATPSAVLLRKVLAGLSTLESALYTMQYQSVQTEVDFIKDVKFPPNLEMKTLEKEAKEAAKAKLKVKTGGGASRLYSSAQIQKLEEWYSKSSRPESSEIQAMYRIINAPQYADAELQPEGIAVKQIRIWFDNRRAKERLDYMRMKMKDEDTSNLDNEDIKKLKAAYIDEAKEVLEARVAKMRETSAGAMEIVEEAEQLALEPSAAPVEVEAVVDSSKRKPAAAAPKAKQRLRMDHVASVRKACRLAREQGLSEEEIKEIRAKAMQAARDRLFFNGKALGAHPLTKDEVTDLKFKLLKLVEEDAPAEACIDILELLLSVDIPAQVLVDTRLDRQLKLVAKSHQENKELVKLATKLSDSIQSVVAAVDDSVPPPAEEKPVSEAKEAAPKVARAKFNVAQLRLLEKAYMLNDAPDKDQLLRLRAKMNKASGEASSDYKQLRCWFYKRKAAGHPPNALAEALAAGDVKPMDEEDSEGDDVVLDDDKVASLPAARKSKVQGRIFSDKQLQVLHAAYDASPRPEASVFDELQDQMNLLSEEESAPITKRQLKNWFSNRRAKDQKGKAVMDDDDGQIKPEAPAVKRDDISRMLLNPDDDDDEVMTQESDDESKGAPKQPTEDETSPLKRKLEMSPTSAAKKPKQA